MDRKSFFKRALLAVGAAVFRMYFKGYYGSGNDTL